MAIQICLCKDKFWKGYMQYVHHICKILSLFWKCFFFFSFQVIPVDKGREDASDGGSGLGGAGGAATAGSAGSSEGGCAGAYIESKELD